MPDRLQNQPSASRSNTLVVIDQTAPLLGSHPDTFRLWRQGGATAVAPTIALNHDAAETVARIGRWLRFIDLNADELLLVREPGDLKRAHRDGRLGIIFHFQNTVPLGLDLNLATVYHDLGVRMIQLAYNQKNFVGDGCEERTDAGLSRFGQELIAEFNRLGIIVDLSHTGYRTTMEAAEASQQPVVFSHANVRAVHASPRNIRDDQIKAVAETGGLVGAVGYPAFVSSSPRPVLNDLIRHIDYIAELVGVNHIGVGIDYFDKMAGFTEDTVASSWYEATVAEGRWSRESYPPPPWHWPEEIADPSKLSALADGLIAHGYTHEDVAKIMGGNFTRVFEQVRGVTGDKR